MCQVVRIFPASIRRSFGTYGRFPQTGEFIGRISDLLLYLVPHYVREGKSYLTIAFGCTGGRHRLGDDRGCGRPQPHGRWVRSEGLA